MPHQLSWMVEGAAYCWWSCTLCYLFFINAAAFMAFTVQKVDGLYAAWNASVNIAAAGLYQRRISCGVERSLPISPELGGKESRRHDCYDRYDN